MSDGLELSDSLSLTQVLPLVVSSLVGRIHTSTVGRVEAYDHTHQRVEVTPLVNHVSAVGAASKYKKLADVPVLFPVGDQGGLTFGLKKGDVGLLVFTERSTDEVLTSGSQETPLDPRTYHLSDGFFIPGVLTGRYLPVAKYADATELSCGQVRVVLRGQKVAIGVGGVEVLKILCDTLQALMTTTVMVAGVPVPLSSVANFTTLFTQLELIRGEL